MNLAKAAVYFLLALISVRAALVTPEFQMDAPLPGLAPGGQSGSQVAFNGRIYVVAWHSQTNAPELYSLVTRWRKFDANGKPLPGIDFIDDRSFYLRGVASNGEDFILMGTTYRNGTTETTAYRLDANGNRVTPEFGVVRLGQNPRIVSDGKDFLLYSNAGTPAFCRITSAGLGPVMSIDPLVGQGFQLAYGDGGYLAVKTVAGPPIRLVAQRISLDGALIGNAIELGIINYAYGSSVTFSQGVFLVTWTQFATESSGGNVVGRRISSSGALLDPAPVAIVGGEKSGLALAGPNGDGFIVTHYSAGYETGTDRLLATRFSAAGAIGNTDTLSEFASSVQHEVAMNMTGRNTLVTSTFYSPGNEDVIAHFIPAGAAAGPPQIVEPGTNAQTAPEAAFGSDMYLVAWQDNRNTVTSNDDIFGRFLAKNGRPIGGAFPIGVGRADQSSPAVAAAGDRFLVAWRDEADDITGDNIKAALIANQQVIRQISICTETNSQRAPAVASNGKDFLVVWRDARSDADDEVYGMHVSADGIVSGPANGFPITTAIDDQQAPAVASNGTNYLVVWRDDRNNVTGYGNDIYGAIVEPGATNLPMNFEICTVVTDQRGPAVASNGSGYFVVWRDERNLQTVGPAPHVYGTAVSSAGLVADRNGIALSPAADSQREPSMARIGNDYMLAWLEWTDFAFFTLRTRQVLSNGSLPSGAAQLSATRYDEDTLALIHGGDGTALVLSQTESEELPRVMAAIVCGANCPTLLDVSFDATSRTLTWNVEPNQRYRVEFKDTLNDATWQVLKEVTASATDSFVQATDVTSATTRFYRVVKTP
jgi:hypothetical protein